MEDDKDPKDDAGEGLKKPLTATADSAVSAAESDQPDRPDASANAAASSASSHASHAPLQGAAWGRPLVIADQKWTKFETWLCAIVIILEIFALSLWVALKGLSTGPDGAKAGIVFRAIFGATMLGMAGYWGLKKQGETPRRIAAIVGVFLGFMLARRWATLGVEWSANMLNWYQQASTLTLFGGLRGVGTRLTLLLALLGGSLATAAGHHITIDLVTRFLKPKVRTYVTIVGWLGAAMICFVASFGFMDHIAIEDFGEKADATTGQKIAKIGHGLSESFFVFRKQIALDFKSLPHMLKGEPYQDWLDGKTWNAWLEDAGFNERYGRAAMEQIRIPDDAKRSPMVVIPEKGEPRGSLTHAANLVFPIGLFIIAVRFLLLCLLTLSGHRKVEAEAHVDLGLRPRDDDAGKAAAQ
jgi:tripartite ATP-independent transporter DctQ subunit